MHPSRQYAGLQRMGSAHAKHRMKVSWVAGHQKAEEMELGSQAWLDAVGNNFADAWADKGRLQHPQQSAGDLASWYKDIELYTKFLTEAAAALSRWAEADTAKIDWASGKPKKPGGAAAPPPVPQGRAGCQHPRLADAVVPPAPKMVLTHRWRRQEGADHSRCTQCLAEASRIPGLECNPARHWANGHNFTNHAVAIFAGGSGFHLVACMACGAWAEARPRMLGGYCLGMPTAATGRDLAFVMAGVHPKYPRERLTPISPEAMEADRQEAACFTTL